MHLRLLDSINWNWQLAGSGREGQEGRMERLVLPVKEGWDQMRSLRLCNFGKMEPHILWCLGRVLLEAWGGDTWDLPVRCCQQESVTFIGKVSATVAADVHGILPLSSYIPSFFYYAFASFCMKWDGYPGSTNNILTFYPNLTNSRRPSICQVERKVGRGFLRKSKRLCCSAYAREHPVVFVQTLTVPFLPVWGLVFAIQSFNSACVWSVCR